MQYWCTTTPAFVAQQTNNYVSVSLTCLELPAKCFNLKNHFANLCTASQKYSRKENVLLSKKG